MYYIHVHVHIQCMYIICIHIYNHAAVLQMCVGVLYCCIPIVSQFIICTIEFSVGILEHVSAYVIVLVFACMSKHWKMFMYVFSVECTEPPFLHCFVIIIAQTSPIILCLFILHSPFSSNNAKIQKSKNKKGL